MQIERKKSIWERFTAFVIALLMASSVLFFLPAKDVQAGSITRAMIDAVCNKYGFKNDTYWTYDYRKVTNSVSAYNAAAVKGFTASNVPYGSVYEGDSVDGTHKGEYKFGGGRQCYAFANFIGYQITGQIPTSSWDYLSVSQVNASGGLQVGDIIRFSNKTWGEHSTMVLSVNNGDIRVVECLGGNYSKNKIKYNGYTNVDPDNSTFAKICKNNSVKYVLRFKGNVPNTNNYSSISSGSYYLKNASTGMYMNVWGAKDANGTNIAPYKFDNADGNKTNEIFQIYSGSFTKSYLMRSFVSSSRVINAYSESPVNGTNVTLYSKTSDSTQTWYFQAASGGYVIRLVYNPDLVITDVGDNIKLQKYTGAKNQIWTLIPVTAVVTFDSNNGTGNQVTETFMYGTKNQKFGYKPDGTPRYSFMNEPDVGFGKWTKDGCKLLGWARTPDATEAQYKTYSGVIDGFIARNPTLTLYAVWEPIEGVTPEPEKPVTPAPEKPTESVTTTPSKPTGSVTTTPSKTPTKVPTKTPTEVPTKAPTSNPTAKPTSKPNKKPNNNVSEAGVGGFVERLYTIALNRNSDPNGKANWIEQTRNGATGADVAKGFLFSSEFLNKNMSREDFVTTLYRIFFDREPDKAGFDTWVNLLKNGASKENVIWGFINSTEWANVCLKYGIASGGTGTPSITIKPNEKVIGFTTRLYTTCLDRPYDPKGLTDWSNTLANLEMSGSEVAHGFFFSSELTKANLSDEEFVTRLYRTFMDREPDEAGFTMWIEMLSNGSTREDVFQGFAGSAEWAVICSEYGILK